MSLICGRICRSQVGVEKSLGILKWGQVVERWL